MATQLAIEFGSRALSIRDRFGRDYKTKRSLLAGRGPTPSASRAPSPRPGKINSEVRSVSPRPGKQSTKESQIIGRAIGRGKSFKTLIQQSYKRKVVRAKINVSAIVAPLEDGPQPEEEVFAGYYTENFTCNSVQALPKPEVAPTVQRAASALEPIPQNARLFDPDKPPIKRGCWRGCGVEDGHGFLQCQFSRNNDFCHLCGFPGKTKYTCPRDYCKARNRRV